VQYKESSQFAVAVRSSRFAVKAWQAVMIFLSSHFISPWVSGQRG
jgi:hypothetical protein